MWHFGGGELQGRVPGAIEMKIACAIGVVAEEADECVLWLELLTESGIVKPEKTADLLKEAKELTAIITHVTTNGKKVVSVNGFQLLNY